MKKILVACGTGMATSTMIASKVSSFLSDQGIMVETSQCSLNEISTNLTNKDLVITSMKVELNIDVPYINGAAFLTGLGADPVKEEILTLLK